MASIQQRRDSIFSRFKSLGLASAQQLEQAEREQANTQERMGAVLSRLGLLRDPDSGKRLAPQLGWLPKPLEPAQVQEAVLQRLPSGVCRTHRVVPIREEPPGHVVLATDDPLTVMAHEWFARQCHAEIELVLVVERDIESLLARLDQSSSRSRGHGCVLRNARLESRDWPPFQTSQPARRFRVSLDTL